MTQSAKEFLEEYKGSRLGCYEFFSHFFGDKRVQPLLDVFPMVEAFVRGENAFLSGSNVTEDTLSEPPQGGNKLEAEYAKLFYGVGSRTIPLSESVYRSEEGILCQAAWRDIKELYGKHNFQPRPEKEMEADSLSMEMAFATVLVMQGKDGKDLLELVEDHLLPVGKAIAKQIRESTDNEDLQNIASTMTVFLMTERALLEQSLKG